jgi:hypothetical protein
LRLVDIGACAEARPSKDLASALLALRKEACVGIGEELTIGGANSRVSCATVIDRCEMNRVVSAREIDRVVE